MERLSSYGGSWDRINSHFLGKMRRTTQQDASEPTNEVETMSNASDFCLEHPVNGVNQITQASPEGGREAWMCLLGSFLMMLPSFGFQTAGKTI
jgi:hypothetical protein